MWFYERAGEQSGPVSQEEAEALIHQGVITRDTRVWRGGMPDWLPAGQAGIAAIFSGPPPLTADGAANAQSSQKAGPRRLSGLMGHARIIIIFNVIFAGGVAAFSLMMLAAQDSLNYDSYGAFEIMRDLFGGIVALGFFIVFFWSWIVIGRWKFRAMANLRARGEKTKISPGWAVGWYFIPIAWLWKPLEAMSEIWRLSMQRAGQSADGGHLGWWWATWVIGNILGWISMRLVGLDMTQADPDALRAAASIDVITAGLHIACALTLLQIMRRVTDAQDQEQP